MTHQLVRWFLLLVLVLDWSELLDLAQQAAVPTQELCLMAPLAFFPFALRYREEVVRRIRLCCQRWQANHLLPPAAFLPHHPVLIGIPNGLPNLGMVRLQP